MSSYQKERDTFLVVFADEAKRARPNIGLTEIQADARTLLRLSTTHGNLAADECNGHPANSSPTMPAAEIAKLQDAWQARIEQKQERTEARAAAILAKYGFKPNFGGDPRGMTLKIHFPSGRSNTWGGQEEGYGIPQRER